MPSRVNAVPAGAGKLLRVPSNQAESAIATAAMMLYDAFFTENQYRLALDRAVCLAVSIDGVAAGFLTRQKCGSKFSHVECVH